MNTTITVDPFELTAVNQAKVVLIYHIANILAHARKPKLTAKEFDHLYDKSLTYLDLMVGVTQPNDYLSERE